MRYACSKCGLEYEVGAEHIGQKLECQCGETFMIAESEVTPEVKPVNNNLMECPDCGAMVSKKAISCPKCGSPFRETPSQPVPAAANNRPIKVDTGENVLNRNRGCADLLLYGPLIFIVIVVILAICGKGC